MVVAPVQMHSDTLGVMQGFARRKIHCVSAAHPYADKWRKMWRVLEHSFDEEEDVVVVRHVMAHVRNRKNVLNAENIRMPTQMKQIH